MIDPNGGDIVRPVEMPVPMSQVRLVFPLPDAQTGVQRDVVINELLLDKGSRYVANLEPRTRIPFPRKDKPKVEDHDVDTLRMDVEDITFTPKLLETPMPSSVIDELRNKYSRFRDRHDDWYLEQKMKEDEEVFAKKLLSKQMETPLMEARRRETAARRAKAKKSLSEAELAQIGAVIAQKRGAAVGDESNSASAS
jgi:large subunit ribosomal protein L24